MKKFLVAGALLTGVLLAGGKGGGAGAGLSLRVASETVPAGATVQAKIELTEPQPIITGHSRFAAAFDDYYGVALASPDGLTVGTAVQDPGGLQLRVVSPTASFGANADYPLIVIAGKVPGSAVSGSTMPMTMSGMEFRDPTGVAYPSEIQDGTLTIGGKLSIHNVIPGGGLRPAGTVIRILGTGFEPASKVNVSEASIGRTEFVSATELRVVLNRAAVVHGNRFRVINKDNEKVEYYAYFRPSYDLGSSSELLNRTKPLYSQSTYSQALFAGDRAAPNAAVAFENDEADGVTIRLELFDVFGNALATRELAVAGETSLSRTVAELFGRTDGVAVRATASRPVRMLGLILVPGSGAVLPVAPVAAGF